MAASGDSVTYAQLEARANRGAHALRALGLNNGDALAIACDNRLEFFDIYWAAQRAGLVLVLLSARLKTDEIAYIVNDSGAKAVLISDAMAGTARDVVANRDAMPGLEQIVTIGAVDDLPDWKALLRRAARHVDSRRTNRRTDGLFLRHHRPPQGAEIRLRHGQPGAGQPDRRDVREAL